MILRTVRFLCVVYAEICVNATPVQRKCWSRCRVLTESLHICSPHDRLATLCTQRVYGANFGLVPTSSVKCMPLIFFQQWTIKRQGLGPEMAYGRKCFQCFPHIRYSIECSKASPCLSTPTSKSDKFQISPAASPEIHFHHTVWRTRLFIAYSDGRWLCYQFALPHL